MKTPLCFSIALALGALIAMPCIAQSQYSTLTGRFDALDTNHDGVVSEDEYDSDATFDALDTDNNNSLSESEVQAVLGPQQDGMPSAADRIRNADKNGDGELSEEELRRGAETRFVWLDTNGDGNLDISEMRAGFGVPMH
jgi:Ca2+-binding EF-hand superfamily protein